MSTVVSERIVMFDERSILTADFCDVLFILKSIEFPRIITDISSPSISGSPFNLFLTKSVNSLSTVITSLIGTKTMFLACFTSVFSISTISFSETPRFFLV